MTHTHAIVHIVENSEEIIQVFRYRNRKHSMGHIAEIIYASNGYALHFIAIVNRDRRVIETHDRCELTGEIN